MGKHAFLLGVYINPNYTDAIINQLLSDKTVQIYEGFYNKCWGGHS